MWKTNQSLTLLIPPLLVSDCEISGRGTARQRLHEIAGSSYSNTGLYHVVVNNFLDSKAQTLCFFLCWKKADNLVCFLFCFFLFESGTSDKYVDLLQSNRQFIAGVLKIYNVFFFAEHLFVLWLWVFLCNRDEDPQNLFICAPLVLTKNGRRGGINSVSDWYFLDCKNILYSFIFQVFPKLHSCFCPLML